MLAEEHVWWKPAPTRIAMARRGTVRLRPTGPDLGLRDGAPLAAARRLWVMDDAERPRVVMDDRDVRLLLYVDRDDARPVVLRAAPLRPTPTTVLGDPPRRGHVILQPGAWVDVTGREGALAKVVYRGSDSKPTFAGWIDAEVLGTTFTVVAAATKTTAERDAEAPRWYTVKRATTLLTRPGGKRLTKVDVDENVLALTDRAANGHRLVQHRPVCNTDLVYVGFVRASDLYQPNYGSVRGCGWGAGKPEKHFGEAKSAPRVTVGAGRFLLDPDEPTVVGCVLQPTEVADLGEGRYAVPTSWGPVPVRLAPEGFEGRCGPSGP